MRKDSLISLTPPPVRLQSHMHELGTTDVDRLIAYQDACTAKLQKQISIMIDNQQKLHEQLFAGSPVQVKLATEFPASEKKSELPTSGKKASSQSPPVAFDTAESRLTQHTKVDDEGFYKPTQSLPSEDASNDSGTQLRLTQNDLNTEADDGKYFKRSRQSSPEEDAADRRARIGEKFKKVATRLSGAPGPLLLSNHPIASMKNVNSDLVRATTSKVLPGMRRESVQESKSGPCARVVGSAAFDLLCAMMLLTDAIFIGVQVQYAAERQVSDLPFTWNVLDWAYSIWFILELLFRLWAAGLSFFTDIEERNWNIFDFVIVVLTSAETVLSTFASFGPLKTLSMIRMVRIARLIKIARIVRLMRFFQPFRVLLTAIFNTLKSCVWAAMLFMIILYMFAICFVQGTTEYRINTAPSLLPEGMVSKYGSLPRGVFTLFKASLGGLDWEDAITPLSDAGAIYVLLFILMITIMFLAIINVISALFLQGAVEASNSDREDVIQAQLKEKEIYAKEALSLFRELDENQDGELTVAEFAAHLKDPRTIGFLNSLEIDVKDAWSLFALLDVEQGGRVNMDEFVEGCLHLKGTAKSVHIAQILFETKWLMDAVLELVKFIDCEFACIHQQLANVNPEGQRLSRISYQSVVTV